MGTKRQPNPVFRIFSTLAMGRRCAITQFVALRGLDFSWQEISFKGRYVTASAYQRFPKNGSYKARKSSGRLKKFDVRCWFEKYKTTPRPVLKRWCGTLEQTGYLQKLSVVFYSSTASQADQLQKLFPCDPKLRSAGFDGASIARLGLPQTGKESWSQRKLGFDWVLLVE